MQGFFAQTEHPLYTKKSENFHKIAQTVWPTESKD